MATALVLEAARQLAFRPEAEPPLQPNDVRLRTLLSGVSAGTELTYYRGTNPFLEKRWDATRRLFVPAEASSASPYPITHLGYEEVGEVIEVGSAVTDIPLGTRVFGTWGHRTRYVATADYVRLRRMPDGADPVFGIFSHLGAIALNGVHDAMPRIGETVAVFGLGALGQIVAMMLKKSGVRVIGIDVQEKRLAMAKSLGVDVTLHATRDQPAEAIKALTAGRGADVCIEVTGVASALHEAIRSVVYAGKVVAMGFLQGEPRGLFLGDEFHHNRIDLVCSQISGVAPERSNRWDKPRLWQRAVQLQAEGLLDLRPVITHRVPFREAPALYERLDRQPQDVVHSVLEFNQEA